MLPSTGYFKAINCPFYDIGLCERPYCHFRHVKKDLQNNNGSDGTESETIFQQLVSEAVKKVLSQADTAGVTKAGQYINSNSSGTTDYLKNVTSVISKTAYNPTPISELKKINSIDEENVEDNSEQRRRHIPVPYTPRKPANYSIKRSIIANGSSKPFIYTPPEAKYTPGTNIKLDPYTPAGSVESKEKYTPGSEVDLPEYSPEENKTCSTSNYIPSDKNLKKKILEYKPIKVNTIANIPSISYRPTPLSQVPCFSSDEDEPAMKKTKLSNEVNALDNLDSEFEMLGQILDEEKPLHKSKVRNHEEKPKHPAAKVKTHEKRKTDKIEKSIKSKIENTNYNNSNEILHKNEKLFSSEKDVTMKDSKTSNIVKKHNSNSFSRSDSRDKDKPKSKESDSKESDSKESYSKSKTNKSSIEHSEKKKRKDKDYSGKQKHNENTIKSLPKSISKHSEFSSSSSRHSNRNSSRHSDKNSKQLDFTPIQSSSSKPEFKKDEQKKKDRDKFDKDKKKSKDKYSKHKINSVDLIDDTNYDDQFNHSGAENNLDELIDEISESDEESIALECKKIFEEYVPTSKSKGQSVPIDTIEDDEYVPIKKRISRTNDKIIKVLPRAPIKPDFKVNAAQAMAARLAKVREFHASKNTLPAPDVEIKSETPKMITPVTTTSSKIRIAHVPYASTLLNAKKIMLSKPSVTKSLPSTSITTTVQTVSKGSQRVAHIPNEKFIDRPGVLEPLASKIPANIRSTYLNLMIDHCLKIYLTPTDAYARAQHEELATSKKCMSVQIYKNSAILTISRLKKEVLESNGVKRSGTDCSALQKLPSSDSGKTNTPTWSIVSRDRKSSIDEFKGTKFYENIQKWILTEEQLRENGFPRPHSSGEKGRANIYVENKKQKPPRGNLRTCCRCKKEYTIDKKGFPAVTEECIYHPNNKYRFRGEVKYQCCSQDGSSDGCSIAPNHVFEYVDYENLRGYVKTMHPERQLDNHGVYALDCEMCYTTHGLDLTRLTVIDSSCKTVFETLIKPLHPILDYNTRYSGITEEQMTGVTTTLLDVQASLLTMFNSKTILIGHSLESDFKALKLIHDTVIDTSVLFPHKMGPPYKRALRNLSSEYLRKIIQNSVDGHNSAEDATVCMELIHYKLREDLKTR